MRDSNNNLDSHACNNDRVPVISVADHAFVELNYIDLEINNLNMQEH